MYSPRLYKFRDSYVLYIPTVQAFGSLSLTHLYFITYVNSKTLVASYSSSFTV